MTKHNLLPQVLVYFVTIFLCWNASLVADWLLVSPHLGFFVALALAKRSQRTQSYTPQLAPEMTPSRWSPFYALVSGTSSKSPGVCWPGRVTASLDETFAKSRERSALWMVKLEEGSPLGTLNDKQRGDWILAPVSAFIWAQWVHTLHDCMSGQETEAMTLEAFQQKSGVWY